MHPAYERADWKDKEKMRYAWEQELIWREAEACRKRTEEYEAKVNATERAYLAELAAKGLPDPRQNHGTPRQVPGDI